MSKESGPQLIFVRYKDHVFFNRASALAMQPQIREAVGWLIYECDHYLTLSWDRDADPPSLQGGDPKASGLVLLKSDVLNIQRLPLQKNSEWQINCPQTTIEDEYAFQPKKRKTPNSRGKANDSS